MDSINFGQDRQDLSCGQQISSRFAALGPDKPRGQPPVDNTTEDRKARGVLLRAYTREHADARDACVAWNLAKEERGYLLRCISRARKRGCLDEMRAVQGDLGRLDQELAEQRRHLEVLGVRVVDGELEVLGVRVVDGVSVDGHVSHEGCVSRGTDITTHIPTSCACKNEPKSEPWKEHSLSFHSGWGGRADPGPGLDVEPEPPVVEVPRSTNRPHRNEVYKFADALRPYQRERVQKCHRTRHSPLVSVHVLYDDKGKRCCHYGGIIRCGSAWECPHCGAKVRAHHAGEVEAAVANHGVYRVEMVTLTMAHTLGDDLRANRQLYTDALQYLQGHRSWKVWKERYGCLGTVRAYDVTSGQHGWHLHTHSLFFVEEKLTTEQRAQARDELAELWQRACVRAALPVNTSVMTGELGYPWIVSIANAWLDAHHPNAKRRWTDEELERFVEVSTTEGREQRRQAKQLERELGEVAPRSPRITKEMKQALIETIGCADGHVPDLEHGVVITQAHRASYIAKMGLELTSTSTKRAKHGSRTPMEIASDIAEHHAAKDIALWKSYCEGMRGARMVDWSDGLREQVGLEEDAPSDEDIALELPPSDVGSMLSGETWDKLAAIPRARVRALELYEVKGPREAERWMGELLGVSVVGPPHPSVNPAAWDAPS